jgi:hypothetical protein
MDGVLFRGHGLAFLIWKVRKIFPTSRPLPPAPLF